MAGGSLSGLRSRNDEWRERKQREHCQIPQNARPNVARQWLKCMKNSLDSLNLFVNVFCHLKPPASGTIVL
jgi:truncated hemoglobin YjbI